MKIHSIVFTTAAESLESKGENIPIIWTLVSCAHFMHRQYNLFRRVKRATTLLNIPLTIAGITLEIALGDKKYIQILAKVVECSERILASLIHYHKFVAACHKFYTLATFKEKLKYKIDFEKAASYSLVSPTTVVYFIEIYKQYEHLALNIGEAFYELVAQFFLMCSALFSACESLKGHDFQVIESPLNLVDGVSHAIELYGMDIKPVTDILLSHMGASFHLQDVITQLPKPQEEVNISPVILLPESAAPKEEGFSLKGWANRLLASTPIAPILALEFPTHHRPEKRYEIPPEILIYQKELEVI